MIRKVFIAIVAIASFWVAHTQPAQENAGVDLIV